MLALAPDVLIEVRPVPAHYLLRFECWHPTCKTGACDRKLSSAVSEQANMSHDSVVSSGSNITDRADHCSSTAVQYESGSRLETPNESPCVTFVRFRSVF